MAGKIPAAPYSLFMRLRRWAYRKGIMRTHVAGVPVICVGNVTVGGTGKTPMVAWVVNLLQRRGRTPAILTRGYKAVNGRSDEADLLKRMTGAPVVVNPDRLAGARRAIAGGADVLVMDDGFGHLRLERDLDIILIDATNPFGGGCCLPAGRLREPLSALPNAGAIVITRADIIQPGFLPHLKEELRRLAPHASLHLAAHKPIGLIDGNGANLPAEALAGRKVFAFSGIGNPGAFAATLERLRINLAGTLALRDHARYTRRRLKDIVSMAERHGAEVLLTTQKDYVKLAELSSARPIWQLAVEMDIVEGRDTLVERIAGASDR